MKPRVIIFYNKLFHYRIPVWNILAQKCDLTVTYSSGDNSSLKDFQVDFKTCYLPSKRFLNRFVIQEDNIRKIAKQFDVAVAYGDISWLKFSTLPWLNKTKVVFHTLGVSASYEKSFDSHREWDFIRCFFYSKADALAFYTSYPIVKYAAMGIPRTKMFEAPNTVEVHPVAHEVNKDSILFIGSLYRQKGIQALLDVYLKLKNDIQLPVLKIIGKGPDSELISNWIQDNNMNGLIEMEGAIYDINKKAEYFASAIACISPRQAGLSVLESMGYGVPFITTKSAITGGELFNIHNGIDGIIMEDEEQLSTIIADIAFNKDKYIEMGNNAQVFYNENRTPQHMADGLWNAIQYAINH